QALELGRQVAKSEPYQKMTALREKILANPEDSKLMEDLENLRQSLKSKQQMGGGIEEEDLRRLSSMEDAAMSKENIAMFYQAKTDFQETAKKVNAKMREGLNEGNASGSPFTGMF
ncbi:MAG: YlbF family regulator, partial [Peptococcaceae bacterium]|nr:YlbF family regulator [Peptococcaceae bacterium]